MENRMPNIGEPNSGYPEVFISVLEHGEYDGCHKFHALINPTKHETNHTSRFAIIR